MRPCRAVVVVAGAVVAAIAVGAGAAVAGAPSFECRVGGLRIGLDTHRSVGLVRMPSGAITTLALESIEAAGPDQRYRLTSGAASGSANVRGAGSMVTTDGVIGHGRGACAFVPGDFAIGTVAAPSAAVRVGPSPDAEIAALLKRGSLLWQSPAATTGGPSSVGMVRVRVVLGVRGGRPDGGEQRLGMGPAAGLDGRSTVVDGWVRSVDVKWAGPPGP